MRKLIFALTGLLVALTTGCGNGDMDNTEITSAGEDIVRETDDNLSSAEDGTVDGGAVIQNAEGDTYVGLYEIGDMEYYESRLKHFELDDNVWRIGSHSFCNALLMEFNAEGKNNLKEIGIGAFTGARITSLILPESLEKIETYAFSGCSRLQYIKIESRDAEIAEDAFRYVGGAADKMVIKCYKGSTMDEYVKTSVYFNEEAGTEIEVIYLD